MADSRVPGHLDQFRRPVSVDDGTLGRSSTPRPGSAGGEIARWPLERKLIEAARRATPMLPREMQGQFAALFTPSSIALTGAVLVAWAASQFFGVGEVADVVLLLIALGTVGWQAFQAAKDVGAFLRIASGAKSDADLDRAAARLAEAVAIVGVTVFMALITKAGVKIGGAARAASAAKMAFWGRSVEEWLILLGKSKAPPLVRDRLEIALGYFRENFPGLPMESIQGYLKGIDLSKPVRVATLRRGENLAMYGDPDRPGLFLTKIGTGIDRLGINPKGRSFVRYEVNQDVQALESRAGGYPDTWTDPDMKYQAEGGGTQYILDVKQFLKEGVLREVRRP